jgi:nuclear pore complex protein Nup98-Nup96
MSGFGGFGGFGQQNNQQQQNTGFGGFGQSANTNTGMQPSFSLHPRRDGARLPAVGQAGESGAHSNLLVPTGFGASSTGTGFGSAQNTAGGGVFGGNTGGFGGSGGTSRMHHLFWLSREQPAVSL